MTQEELNALANEFYDYLANQKDFYEVWPSEDDTICVDISWGDWKHDHLRLDMIADKFFEEKGYDILDMDTDVTDEDGSDTYSATHSYRLRKHVEESLNEDEELFKKYGANPSKSSRGWDAGDLHKYEDGLVLSYSSKKDAEEAANKLKQDGFKISSIDNDDIQSNGKGLEWNVYCFKESLDNKDALKEESNDKGNRIAKLIAKAYKGMVGPFGGEDPYLDGNKVTFHSQGPNESWIFNDDGSVDSGDDVDYLVAHSDPSDYGCENEEELRDYFEEIQHFDSVKDLFDSGLNWFMEVPNEEELLRKINNILNESLKEEVESKVRLENPKLVSWKEMYINDVCNGDEDEFFELYFDENDDEYWNENCQAFFSVVDDKNNYLGTIGAYKFDSNGYWYEIGFEPNERYLNKDKLEMVDLDLPIDGWFDDTKNGANLLSEEDYRELLKSYLPKIENALEEELDDED